MKTTAWSMQVLCFIEDVETTGLKMLKCHSRQVNCTPSTVFLAVSVVCYLNGVSVN